MAAAGRQAACRGLEIASTRIWACPVLLGTLLLGFQGRLKANPPFWASLDVEINLEIEWLASV